MVHPADQQHPHRATRAERALGLVLLATLLVGSFLVLRPFLSALLWAVILGFSLWPVQRRLTRWLRGRRSLAAILIVLAIAAAMFVPLIVTVANLADDARALAAVGRAWFQTGPPPAPHWLRSAPVIGQPAAKRWDDVAGEIHVVVGEWRSADDTTTSTVAAPETRPRIRQTLQAIVTWLRSLIVTFGLAIGTGVTQVALSLLLTFFILKDGEALATRLANAARRISGEQGTQLLDVAGGTVRGVVYGILGTALAQGLMAGIGFLIAGVPGATLLGLLTFFLSVLPMGPPLVWIPVTIWLFNRGSPGWGIFMLIWGLAVSSVDNVVKPWIISRGSKMPFILIFLGVLGGALTFGLIGAFLGPTLLAVAYRLISEWSRTQESTAAAPTATTEPVDSNGPTFHRPLHPEPVNLDPRKSA